MKKLVIGLLCIATTMPFLAYTVSCGDNYKNYGIDLASIKDYDWSSEEPYYKGHENNLKWDLPNEAQESVLKVSEVNNYLDYKNFNTGFKTYNEVLKQSPTGVPLNSKFLPNGSRKKNMMEISRQEIFDEVNSILDWNYNNDIDAKYNKSRIDLQKTTKTASKWVESQDPTVKEMNMPVIINSTSKENTIIGKKRSYNRSFNNYQYNDVMVSWAGAIDEGIIVPPGKNEVEKAHINGTKILGNIFLDGYHGLKKSHLRDFLKQDSQGNYLIIDVLINMVVDLGFDGWFWNNEPNGYFQDGYILKYSIVIEMMKQWNDKIKKSNDPKVNELILFTYKNNGSLEIDKNGNPISSESTELQKNSDKFLSDFGVTPNNSEKYLDKENKWDESKEIYNMYNLGGWINSEIFYNKDRIGRRDLRDLVYYHLDENCNKYEDNIAKEKADKNENKWKYDTSKTINSLAIFASHTSSDLAEMEMNEIGKDRNSDTYGLAKQNYYDDMIYTGHNRQLSDEDFGSVSYDPKTFHKDSSYGVGNIVQEKTVLNDFNESFFTNFSTGNGDKFVTLNNSDGYQKRIVEDNYTWSNTNIADVQPTYKWMVNILENNGKISSVDSEKISGYYDYKDPYLKGNSIALGSGIEKDGSIAKAEFEKDATYDWMIMGTNYTKNQSLDISMIIKSDSDDISPSIIIEGIDGNAKSLATNSKDLGDGWKEISATLEPNETVAKIGLRFKATNSKMKVNVGQFSINKNKLTKENDLTKSIEAKSELVIERNNEYKNIRINFKDLFKENDIYSYYEVYYEDKNNLYRVGETNSNNYFVKNIPIETNNLYIKIQNNATNKMEWVKLKIGV
ncbi:endo-beta-N-acetylglucosaminidase [Spiroplasma monobiae]|uniref:Endo-beta-N-acetylglucosaminidase n=1 Tax=Spiroplasma monobiae MQ-1 TaxID=1336748 RepID=A0A2K9LY46_SPISQ|nr:hypothetical protein [Spiroplasma monobiae]AUM62654.1 endo-beta-N-acetylglucosaminidase [Spiroplasma monobiae MQ-1]